MFVVQEYLRLPVIRVQKGMPICRNKWLWAAAASEAALTPHDAGEAAVYRRTIHVSQPIPHSNLHSQTF